jgi:hypothetical protein
MSFAGKAYVFLGAPGGLTTSPAAMIAAPDGANSAFGESVSGLGDVNGDGLAEIMIGAGGVSSNTGRVYVFAGTATVTSTTPLVTLVGPDGAGGHFGHSIAGAGDVNGDGRADALVGAWGVGTGYTGRVYLFTGTSTGIGTAAISTISGPDGGEFGAAVSGAHDMNADGFDDVVVGAHTANGGVGRAYLFAGSAAGLASTPLSVLTGPDAAGGDFGGAVAGIGNVNGDGFPDVAVAASRASTGTGRVYFFLGASAGISFPATLTLSGLEPSGQFGAALSRSP